MNLPHRTTSSPELMGQRDSAAAFEKALRTLSLSEALLPIEALLVTDPDVDKVPRKSVSVTSRLPVKLRHLRLVKAIVPNIASPGNRVLTRPREDTAAW
jgi:hypothetical protein